MQCPFNANHFVPCSSLKDHSEKCQYATVLGTDSYKIDWEEVCTLKGGASFLYQNSAAEVAHVGNVVMCSLAVNVRMLCEVFPCIGKPVVDAVRKLAENLPEIERVVKSREDQARQEQFSSLEETQSSPIQFQFKDAPQMIRSEVISCNPNIT